MNAGNTLCIYERGGFHAGNTLGIYERGGLNAGNTLCTSNGSSHHTISNRGKKGLSSPNGPLSLGDPLPLCGAALNHFKEPAV